MLGSITIYPTDVGREPHAVPPAVAVAPEGDLVHVPAPQGHGGRGARAAEPVFLRKHPESEPLEI